MTVTTPGAPERPSLAQIWDWLEEVPDPEIPVVSVVDLGIVRELAWCGEGDTAELRVAITPTYSGCPATQVIARDIETALRDHGIQRLRLESRLSPAWTTHWISESGREKLRRYGIAPPLAEQPGQSGLTRLKRRPLTLECPRCGSTHTEKISEFGSTPCKAQYRCRDCLEPFDYFKCI